MSFKKTLLAVALATVGLHAQAAIVHNSEIAGNVIFGGGNADGGWTINQTGNMELAMRAKVRHDVATGAPANVFNADGFGNFNHAAGAHASVPTRSSWNFEWSVNTDVSGTGGGKIDDHTYVLGIDTDAGFGATFATYNLLGTPLTVGAPMDHWFGNGTTASGGGTRATSAALFASLIESSSLMQQSSNMDFVDDGAVLPFDFNPNLDGNYSFFLEARSLTGELIGRTEITVIVGAGATAPVSAPASLALAGLGLLALGATRRRKA